MHAAELHHPAGHRDERAMSRRWDVFLGGLVFMLGAAYLTSALLASSLLRPDTAAQLAPVPALVQGAEVVARPSPPDRDVTYGVRVHCAFPWQGRQCITSTESSCEESPPLGYGDATDKAAQFQPGTSVAVLVDPRDPLRVLLDNRTRHSLVPALLMLALTGAGAFLTLVGWRGWPLVAHASRH